MSPAGTVPPDATDPPPTARLVLGTLVTVVLLPALLFGTAGTAAWPMGWAYIAVSLAGILGAFGAVLRRHPDTLTERARGLRAPDTPPWDRALVRLVAWGPIVTVVVAGLDHRFRASSFAATPLQLAALVAAAAGYLLAGRAMAANRFFSSVVRIQDDRGHAVIDSGPYRRIRHPGYAGALLVTAAIPVILDSAWALLPAALTLAALLARTALEDRMLRADLPGYDDYATRTPWRLLPHLW